jgi:hypothetical protein
MAPILTLGLSADAKDVSLPMAVVSVPENCVLSEADTAPGHEQGWKGSVCRDSVQKLSIAVRGRELHVDEIGKEGRKRVIDGLLEDLRRHGPGTLEVSKRWQDQGETGVTTRTRTAKGNQILSQLTVRDSGCVLMSIVGKDADMVEETATRFFPSIRWIEHGAVSQPRP